MDFTAYTVLFVTALLTSNVTAAKVVQLGPFLVPAAVVAYILAFVTMDIIHERFGFARARQAVYLGFGAQALSAALVYAGQVLPAAPFAAGVHEAYVTVLGQTGRFVVASFTAYLASQLLDIHIFRLIRERWRAPRWVRKNLSTLVSQGVDTALFITIAFAGTVPALAPMILSQYAVKTALSVLGTPIFLVATRRGGHEAVGDGEGMAA